MRWNLLDRCLLLCFLFSALIPLQGAVRAACDNKCRLIKTFVQDHPINGVVCYNYWQQDCRDCTGGGGFFACDQGNQPGNGNCNIDMVTSQWRQKMDGCNLVCTLQVGGRAEASGGNPLEDFKMFGNR